jgi:hypothetical protein
MRRKIFFIGALASSLSVTTPVMAFNWGNIVNNTQKQSTDKEILFRDIPWGINFNDTCELLPEFELYGSTMEGLNAIGTKEVLTGKMYDSSSDYDGEISYYAMPLISPDIDVAGYPVYCFYLYYTYSIENGFSLTDDNTVLYGAEYEFEEPQDLEAMYSDLTNKLSEIYGEPSDSYDTANYLVNGTYACWYGANDTVVALQSYDYGDQTSIYISYAWLKGDELLQKADSALSTDKGNSEAEIYGNGSTNGL